MSPRTPSPETIDYSNPPFPLTAIDRHLLSITDAEFQTITWPDLQAILAANTLEELKRRPSDLRRYLAWSHATKRRYGSITNFVVEERLHWRPLPSASGHGGVAFEHVDAVPFRDRRDYAVLVNDWPYGFEGGIRHLLVWSKTPIAVDGRVGDVTEESRRVIEEFVERYFVRPLGEEGRGKVLWFKNWVSLQSVRGVDHVHVLVRDVDDETVEEWTRRRDV